MKVAFPHSANQRGSTELDAPLEVIAGTLPISLRGSVFGVAPAGPYAPNTPFLNGEPLFYRIDFSEGTARVATHLGRGPGARIEAAARAAGVPWAFRDFGITRLSTKLGARDFSNTAIVATRAADGSPRLIATYDAGRPHHLDPLTLELVAPLEAQRSWRANLLMSRPFKQIFSTAHPCFDGSTGELFAVNHGRALRVVTSRLFQFMKQWLPWLPWQRRSLGEAVDDTASTLRNALTAALHLGELPARGAAALLALMRDLATGARTLSPAALASQLSRRGAFARWLVHFGLMLKDFTAEGPLVGEAPKESFTYLLRWRGEGPPRRYELRRQGEAVEVLESAHQMAVTRDWVIFVDAAFKMEIDGIASAPDGVPDEVIAAVRREVSRPQSHTARFYFVRRADLDRDDLPTNGHPSFPASVVEAYRVEVEGEVVHFHADFSATPEGHVTLHAIHQNAMDGAEFVLRGDRRYDGEALPPEVFGTFPTAMAANAVGTHIVEPTRERVVSSRRVSSADDGWALGLTAGPGINTFGDERERLSDLYVYSQGLVPDQLTELIHALYEEHPARNEAELARLLAQGGAPAALLRVDLTEARIAERLTLAGDQQLVSPQYVPDGEGAGWIVCNVFSGDASIAAGSKAREVWILRAGAIAEGPVARLWHPELDWGYTLHTAWLPRVAALPREGLVSLAEDVAEWLPDPAFRRFWDAHLRPR